MALEWVVLSYTAAAEATLLLLLTIPLLNPVRRSAAAASRAALKPLVALVPFSLFLLLDIYWKYEARPLCDNKGHGCNPTELIRYQKSLAKAQRNTVLIASALLMYWLLFAVSGFVVQLEHLEQRLQKLMNQD
ncbi:B-cell receptor-associated protein 29/31 [Dioscorea alata]|uniref:B-cell receptor-associated protein 29/31 n=1 Tax=Dioscorea alata TaxID=55571 RepID=A0ACB7TXS2_DIOAL|nr:B-cell receptor-associated protein 29/31 [Dioscorea alata]